jgi:hypothetical protein
MTLPARLSRAVPVIALSLTALACQDSTAPAASARPIVRSNPAVIYAAPNKPKKNAPSITNVQLSTTTLVLGQGTAATYTLTVANPIGKTYTDVNVQGEIVQGSNRAGAGALPLECSPGVFGVLPGGTCTDPFLTVSTATSNVLVPGAAELVVTLYQIVGTGTITFSTASVPIQLVAVP